MKDIRLVMKVVDENQNTLYVVDDKTNVYSETDYNRLSKTCNFINDFGNCSRIVRIKSKVKDSNGNILWYLDENLKRYSLEELTSLINSKRVAVNMYLRNNVPTSYSGEIESLYKTDDVLVVIEDSTGGYKFYKWFLESCFPLVNFHCISSEGNGNLYRETIKNVGTFDKLAVIFDNKLDDTAVTSNIDELYLTLESKNKQFIFFKPTCVEEVLLSFKELYLMFNRYDSIIDLCSDIVINNELYYRYENGNYHILKLNYDTNNLEVFLANKLTNLTYKTGLTYNNKKIGGCFMTDCCSNLSRFKIIDTSINHVITTDMFMHKEDYVKCNRNDKVKFRVDYYSKYSILKYLYDSVNILMSNKNSLVLNDLFIAGRV